MHFPSNDDMENIGQGHDAHIMTLTYIFKVTQFEMLRSVETVRASEKCRTMTFRDIVIRHRTGPLRMLYSVILTYIFKVDNFKL